MHAYRIVWEDEAKGREVEILVRYQHTAGIVSIDAIQPMQVTLYDLQSRQPSRVLPVHTAGGRRLLTQAYLAAREAAATLEEEILAQHDQRDQALAVSA
jgi:hypothetical protein